MEYKFVLVYNQLWQLINLVTNTLKGLPAYFKIVFLGYTQPQKAVILSNHSYTTLDYNYGVEISGL